MLHKSPHTKIGVLMIKKLTFITLAVLLTFSCRIIDVDKHTSISESDFADPDFANAVHESLGSWQNLNEFNTESVRELRLSYNDFSDISGIEIFTNLIYLSLNNCGVSDITDLSLLHRLYTVYLNDNQITDVSSLSGLTELRALDLSNNDVQSGISGLLSLTNLNYLDLRGNYNISYADYQVLNNGFSDINLLLPVVWKPETPANFSATPGNASITLNWDAVVGFDNYRIYWSTTPGLDEYSELINDEIIGESFTHTDLNNDETYYYVISAVKDNIEEADTGIIGESLFSAEINATPLSSL